MMTAKEQEVRAAVEWFREFVANRRWQFAKTMAYMPHEYTIGKWEPSRRAEFDTAVSLIGEYGEDRQFGKRRFRYLDVDGWTYWASDPPTTLINRAQIV